MIQKTNDLKIWKNGTFKYPTNRFGRHLSKRIFALSDIRFYNDVVIQGFHDAMPSSISYPNPYFSVESDI